MQSGKPVGVFRTHPEAPRVLIANSNLVGHWSNWEEFHRLEQLGLTMYGQMTAGSWIYIGSQGIVQGTYETFAACGATSTSAAIARGQARRVRRPGRHGRRAAAGGDHERRARSSASTSIRRASSKRLETGYCDRMAPIARRSARVLADGAGRRGALGRAGRQLRRRAAGAGAARHRARTSSPIRPARTTR